MKTDCPLLSKIFYFLASVAGVLFFLLAILFLFCDFLDIPLYDFLDIPPWVLFTTTLMAGLEHVAFFGVIGSGYHLLVENTFFQEKLYEKNLKEKRSADQEVRNKTQAIRESLPEKKCPTCKTPLKKEQIRNLGDMRYNKWYREGYCRLECCK